MVCFFGDIQRGMGSVLGLRRKASFLREDRTSLPPPVAAEVGTPPAAPGDIAPVPLYALLPQSPKGGTTVDLERRLVDKVLRGLTIDRPAAAEGPMLKPSPAMERGGPRGSPNDLHLRIEFDERVRRRRDPDLATSDAIVTELKLIFRFGILKF